ncbi:hypothetical protein HM1_1186 [Heliomicrobium modesticaldum Ice1]|uniref:Uncharacterized protein n=1 Tax=Heliobacterium modesticaldum (strain ATCC 51547 / Ice1) TaxID=498761 RepID=B0THF0_HELMI|nr:hypothetical protein HM1_1186 [Heliomicrobium modesticaldum Ice1]
MNRTDPLAGPWRKPPALLNANRRENLIGEMVKEVIQYAKDRQCGVAFEDLKF